MSLRPRAATCRRRHHAAVAEMMTTSCEPLESRTLFAVTTTNLRDIADATVRDGSYANTNYGQSTVLEDKLNSAAGYTRRSYLTFDTSAVAGNSTAAVMRVYGGLLETSTMPVGIFAVPSTSWSENSITWNNKPATVGNALSTKSIAGASKQWYEYDVTSYVAAERAAGRTTVSFALLATQSTSSALANFNSDEAPSNRPELRITADDSTSPTPTPTPTTPTPTPTGPTLKQLTLVNTQTALDIGPFNGGQIQSGAAISVRADPQSGVGSVKFVTDGGTTRIETTQPYAVAGDNGWSNYTTWTPSVGQHTLVVTPYSGAGGTGTAGTPITVNFTVTPSSPTPTPTALPSITAATSVYGVVVGPGKVTLSNGNVIDVAGGTLTLANPNFSSHTYTGVVPPNYASQDPSQRWPDNAANLHPTVDTLMLGGLYRGVVGSSVVVKNSSGKVFTRDVDYKLNTEWGQLMSLNSRLGSPGSGSVTITYQSVDQRLDLIQVLPNGSLSVKKGTPAVVCPTLPQPDAGAVGIAGVLVYTLNGARNSGFVMEQRNIFPIKPAAPVQGVNLSTIPNTLNKLRTGGNVRVAYFGDSITEGAEAGSWWSDRSKTYTSLTTAGLRSRFPSATITEFRASQGGKSLYDSQATWQTILDLDASGQQVDAVVINLGMNDTGLPATINSSRSALATYIDQARARGIEVIVMTPIESNPYYNPSNRAPRSTVAAAIKDVALSKNAAFLDMYQEWVNQGTRGVAPFSQLHNTYNHPGVAGMRLMADALLRMFPKT